MAILGFVLGGLVLLYASCALLILLAAANGFSGGLGDGLVAWWTGALAVAAGWYLLFANAPFTVIIQ